LITTCTLYIFAKRISLPSKYHDIPQFRFLGWIVGANSIVDYTRQNDILSRSLLLSICAYSGHHSQPFTTPFICFITTRTIISHSHWTSLVRCLERCIVFFFEGQYKGWYISEKSKCILKERGFCYGSLYAHHNLNITIGFILYIQRLLLSAVTV
jgi:hypothetical protein